jgi:hypothetical protein
MIDLNVKPKVSYSDVVVYVGTSIYKLSVDYDIMLTCSRTGGWELWRGDQLLGGEFSSQTFRIIVGTNVICDNVAEEVQEDSHFGVS